VAGTGKQARQAFFGESPNKTLPRRLTREPLSVELASPWDLLIHDQTIFIAMAGPHQIWTMDIAGEEIGPFAGSGLEDIVDGSLLPKKPYRVGSASAFAQPSGLATDGDQLFVADSEGSSIRALPLDIDGLKPLVEVKPKKLIKLPADAQEFQLPATTLGDGQLEIRIPIKYQLPDGWKMNSAAPQGYVALWKDSAGKNLEDSSVSGKFAEPGNSVILELKVPSGSQFTLQIGLTYYFASPTVPVCVERILRSIA
jgi:hypothetical protein